MPYYGSVTVIDRLGWAKRHDLEKSLLMIGSASVNDIVLPLDRGSGVASIHLQVVHPQADQSRIRVVNLANTAVPIRPNGGVETAAISANGSADLGDGDSITLGDFSLTFSIQSQNGFTASARSDHMGLRLELPGLELKAGARLAGRLTVSNYGEQKRCQFEIELDGLPGDCYQIDPVPLLFPKGEEYLQIRFFHRGSRPPAGNCPIRLKVTAPGTYPTEMIVLPAPLEIMPVYRYEVAIEGAVEVETHAASRLPARPARLAEEPPFTNPPARSTVEVVPESSAAPAPSGSLFASAEPDGDRPDSPLPDSPIEPPVVVPTPILSGVQAAENRQDPFANPGQVRRPRLPLNGQPIQVLKTPEEPSMADAGLSQTSPVQENKEP